MWLLYLSFIVRISKEFKNMVPFSALVSCRLLRPSPKKAEGETVPLLRETMTLMPVSMKGTEKSMTSDLSSLMVKEPTAM